MRKGLLSTVGIAALVVILVLVNALSKSVFSRAYVDLTEEGLYSISSGTRNILRHNESPITLRFYFSSAEAGDIPALKLYGQRVLNLLKEYERLGNGKITLQTYDPQPDSEEEEWALKYGLTPLSFPTGARIFIGLAAVNSRGVENVIPVFNLSRQEVLEYDISKVIQTLSTEKKPVIGILSALPVNGAGENKIPGRPQAQNSEPWYFVSLLSQIAEVRKVEFDAKSIDKDIDLLMVIHPKKLSSETEYAIDQFVMRGGRLFLAIDPYCQIDQPPQDPQNPSAAMFADRGSNVETLLSAWGVKLEPANVVGDRTLSTRVNFAQGVPPQEFMLFLSLRPIELPGGLNVINRKDLISSELDQILLAYAGELKVESKEGVITEPLLLSSTDSQLVPERDYRFNGGDPQALSRQFKADNTSHILALRISGNLDSAFPNGKPGASEAEKSMSSVEGHLARSLGNANIVVIADADFLSNYFSVSVQNILGTQMASLLNDNLNFVQNIGENLLGSDDLISLRSRGKFSRPFVKVEELQKKAEARWQREEEVLQAKLRGANQRLNQLQAGIDPNVSSQIVSEAVIDEVKKFREEKIEAQKKLREVRRNLRGDIEDLGNTLFLINTFAVPLFLIIFVFYRYNRRKKISRKA